jgi:hypothetical protein
MFTSTNKSLFFVAFCLAVSLLFGCQGGPIYRLWHRQQWLEDEQYGTTLHSRLEELAALRRQAEGMDAAEQARIVRDLNRAVAEDPSALYRGQVVRTLGALSTPLAAQGLQLAIRDGDPSVRILACRAWAQRGGEEAIQSLSQVVRQDTDLDVRLAATRELASFKQPSVIPALGLALEDPDPALQYRAVQSLKSVTGKDFGNSIAAWRQFVRDGSMQPAEEPSLAERLRNLF